MESRHGPFEMTNLIFFGRGVAEEIYVEGFAGCGPDRFQFRLHGVQAQGCAGQRAQPARVGYRDRHFAALPAGHGRLDDGKIDPKKFLQIHHLHVPIAPLPLDHFAQRIRGAAMSPARVEEHQLKCLHSYRFLHE